MVADEIKTIFGNQVRVRIMGLLIQNQKVLVLNHAGLNAENTFWSPPGGGVDFGMTLIESLRKEFKEETNLEVEKCSYLFGHEFLRKDLHAIELFFKIDAYKGEPKLGSDPEMNGKDIINELAFKRLEELKIIGTGCYHEVFDKVESLDELFMNKEIFYLRNIP